MQYAQTATAAEVTATVVALRKLVKLALDWMNAKEAQLRAAVAEYHEFPHASTSVAMWDADRAYAEARASWVTYRSIFAEYEAASRK